jgi:hypothetical protein
MGSWGSAPPEGRNGRKENTEKRHQAMKRPASDPDPDPRQRYMIYEFARSQPSQLRAGKQRASDDERFLGGGGGLLRLRAPAKSLTGNPSPCHAGTDRDKEPYQDRTEARRAKPNIRVRPDKWQSRARANEGENKTTGGKSSEFRVHSDKVH